MLYVGSEASGILKALSPDHIISKEFLTSLKKAYVFTAQYMLKKLPLGNSMLISLSCLDPELRQKTSTLLAFRKLSSLLSHTFIDSEKQSIDYGCRPYQAQSYTANEIVHSFD